MEHRELLERALDVHGIDTQMRQLQEECCELGAEVNHCFRSGEVTSDFLAELADVQIMLDQMVIHMERTDPALLDEIYKIRLKKLERLKGRLDALEAK